MWSMYLFVLNPSTTLDLLATRPIPGQIKTVKTTKVIILIKTTTTYHDAHLYYWLNIPWINCTMSISTMAQIYHGKNYLSSYTTCLVSYAWCPISDILYLVHYVWCIMSGVFCLFLVSYVWCIISGVIHMTSIFTMAQIYHGENYLFSYTACPVYMPSVLCLVYFVFFWSHMYDVLCPVSQAWCQIGSKFSPISRISSLPGSFRKIPWHNNY